VLVFGAGDCKNGPNPENEQACSFSGLVAVTEVEGWPPTHVSSEGGAGSGRQSPLHHPNREREDGGWQVKPPTRVSSKGGAGSGRESLRHPNREREDGGWQVKPPTRVSSEGGWVQIPSVTQIASGRVVVGW
jgi:hypothetical protein